MSTVHHDLMSDGSEFHVQGATTENARWPMSVCVLGTVNSMAWDDHWDHTSTTVSISSL